MKTVEEEVDWSEGRSKERSPHPMIVFGTQMEVTQENSCLTTSYDQDDKDEE